MINYNHHHGEILSPDRFPPLSSRKKPTMVGICHGGNIPLGQDDEDDDEDDETFSMVNLGQ